MLKVTLCFDFMQALKKPQKMQPKSSNEKLFSVLQVSLRRRKESLSREASLEGVRRQVSVDPGEPTLQDKPQLPVKERQFSIFRTHKINIRLQSCSFKGTFATD